MIRKRGRNSLREVLMKRFQHRDKWFYVLSQRAPDWVGSRYAVFTPNHLSKDIWTHYYYIEKDDSLWKISSKELLEKRVKYNGRWHIDRAFLTQIPITDEWRENIGGYKRDKR